MMPWLTAGVLAAFVGYAAAWFFDRVEGDFALLLFMATAVTGIYWVAEQLIFLPRRRAAADLLEAQLEARQAELANQGITQVDTGMGEARHRILMQPWWLDWTAGLFPVILAVFVLRSFLFEPFKIPSGSMIPTLLVGDLILVNKFTYGVRLPVVNTKLTDGTAPQRGDVMVFRYPPQPSMNYIKRVVGVPGDEVAYLNKRLTINGKPVETKPLPDYFDGDAMRYFRQFEETFGERRHRILNDETRAAHVGEESVVEFPNKSNCRYSVEGVVCKVPAGHYFMMGDNRDNSQDSRYWGFVPDRNIVGKAIVIWMNFSSLKRIGTFD